MNTASVEAEVVRIGEELGVDLAFCAKHLETGTTIGLSQDRYRTMASVMKLPIALTLLHRVDRGEVAIDAMHSFTAADMSVGGWFTEPLVRNGGEIALTTYTVIDAALRISDNAAWLKMVEICGGIEAVQCYLEARGLHGIRCTHTIGEGYLERFTQMGYERPLPTSEITNEQRKLLMDYYDEHRDTCTPAGMVELLARLHRLELLSNESTEVVLGIMRRCETSDEKLRAMMPPGVPIADKTGTISWMMASDAGLVTLPDDRGVIAIAVFSKAHDRTPKELDSAIAHVGRLVYDAFLLCG